MALQNPELLQSDGSKSVQDQIATFAKKTGVVPTAASFENFTVKQQQKLAYKRVLDERGYADYKKRMTTPVWDMLGPLPRRDLLSSTPHKRHPIPIPYVAPGLGNVRTDLVHNGDAFPVPAAIPAKSRNEQKKISKANKRKIMTEDQQEIKKREERARKQRQREQRTQEKGN